MGTKVSLLRQLVYSVAESRWKSWKTSRQTGNDAALIVCRFLLMEARLSQPSLSTGCNGRRLNWGAFLSSLTTQSALLQAGSHTFTLRVWWRRGWWWGWIFYQSPERETTVSDTYSIIDDDAVSEGRGHSCWPARSLRDSSPVWDSSPVFKTPAQSLRDSRPVSGLP